MVIKPLKKKAKLAHKNLIETFLSSKNLLVYTNKSEINKKVRTLATAKSIT